MNEETERDVLMQDLHQLEHERDELTTKNTELKKSVAELEQRLHDTNTCLDVANGLIRIYEGRIDKAVMGLQDLEIAWGIVSFSWKGDKGMEPVIDLSREALSILNPGTNKG